MDSRESPGGLIDEDGTLLGVVNVFDALVVLLVLGAGIAGAALMTGDQLEASPERTTAHVTLDVGSQPAYIAAAISEGDSYSTVEGSNLTVTGVRLAPADTGTHVVVGAALRGVASDGRVRYGNAPLHLGRELSIRTRTYNLTGNVSEFGREPTLDANKTTVVVRERMVPRAADEIASGDRITVAGRTVGTVSAVAAYPTSNASDRVVLVAADLQTHTQRGEPYFGDRQVSPGRTLRLPTRAAVIDGRVERVGAGLGDEARTSRTVTLEATRVRSAVASVVRPGLTDRSGGPATANVTAVSAAPSSIVAATANGSVVTGDHPTLRDVTMTAELRVRETDDGVLFRGERLQYGSAVVLDLGPVTVEATVVDIGE